MVLSTEIYCHVGFESHLLNDPIEELELPEVVPPSIEMKAKSFSAELEVSSMTMCYPSLPLLTPFYTLL